ncbi:hypothetical protein BT93_A1192 [Corymbia citriodora subsp. variegata]|nr:hypothetical protein BT93_A1192 [Corymbia citriodora subsp. variegata]
MEEAVEKKASRSEAPKAPPEPENGAEEKIVISAPSKKVAFAADKGSLGLTSFLLMGSYAMFPDVEWLRSAVLTSRSQMK